MIVLLHLLSLILTAAYGEVQVNIKETAAVTMPCNHGSTYIQTVFWELRSDDSIIAELYNHTLKRIHQKFLGRVKMSDPDGDLTISNVSRNDVDFYRCVTIQRGVRVESSDGWHKLNVLVKPEKFKITCSGNSFSTPSEDCLDIKQSAIKSIQCEVYSNPESTLVWSQVPQGCGIKQSGTLQDIGILRKQTSLLRNLCDGKYCCLAAYQSNIANTVTKCIDVGDTPPVVHSDIKSEEPKNDGDDGKSNTNTTVIIASSVLAVISLIGIIIIIKYMDKSRLREDFPILCRCCPKANVKPLELDTEKMESKDDTDDIVIEAEEFDASAKVNPIRYSTNEEPSLTYASGPPPYSDHVVDEAEAKSASSPRSMLKRQKSIEEEEIVKSASSPSAPPIQQDFDDVDGSSVCDPFLQNVDDNRNELQRSRLTSIPEHEPSSPVPKKLKISIYRKTDLNKRKVENTGANAYPK